MSVLLRRKTSMPSPDDALAGREERIPAPDRHFVLDTPLEPPFPEGTERAVLHTEQLGDLHPREDCALRAQEEARGLAIEHEVAQVGFGEPGARREVGHRRVEALAPQRRVEEVELRKLELGDRRHWGTVTPAR